MSINLVVFDWNGTLLDDINELLQGVNAVLASVGKPAASVDAYREAYDMPVSRIFNHFGISDTELQQNSQQLAETFHHTYEPLAARAALRVGALATLQELQSDGIKMIILSNHTVEGIYMQLERLSLTEYFEAVLANDTLNGSHFAGKHDRLQEYLITHDIEASTAAIIGDTVEEVNIGKSLGLHTIAITGGYHTDERLQAANPDARIDELSELPEVLKRL